MQTMTFDLETRPNIEVCKHCARFFENVDNVAKMYYHLCLDNNWIQKNDYLGNNYHNLDFKIPKNCGFILEHLVQQ